MALSFGAECERLTKDDPRFSVQNNENSANIDKVAKLNSIDLGQYVSKKYLEFTEPEMKTSTQVQQPTILGFGTNTVIPPPPPLQPQQQQQIYGSDVIERIAKTDDLCSLRSLLADESLGINTEFFTPSQPMMPIDWFAKYAAIRCFKFSLLNGAKLTPNILLFGIEGGDQEIIQLLIENGIVPNPQSLISSIRFHRYDVMRWLFDQYSLSFDGGCLEVSITSLNIPALLLLPSSNRFACKSVHPSPIVSSILLSSNVQINTHNICTADEDDFLYDAIVSSGQVSLYYYFFVSCPKTLIKLISHTPPDKPNPTFIESLLNNGNAEVFEVFLSVTNSASNLTSFSHFNEIRNQKFVEIAVRLGLDPQTGLNSTKSVVAARVFLSHGAVLRGEHLSKSLSDYNWKLSCEFLKHGAAVDDRILYLVSSLQFLFFNSQQQQLQQLQLLQQLQQQNAMMTTTPNFNPILHFYHGRIIEMLSRKMKARELTRCLLLAATSSIGLCRQLIDLGADINGLFHFPSENRCFSVLEMAVFNPNPMEMFHFLLSRGATIRYSINDPLSFYCTTHSNKFNSQLAEQFLHLIPNYSLSPVFYQALLNFSISDLEKIYSYGIIDLNEPYGVTEKSRSVFLIHLITHPNFIPNFEEKFEFLVSHGADQNAGDKEPPIISLLKLTFSQENLLQGTTYHNRLETLLKSGVDIFLPNWSEGKCGLDLVVAMEQNPQFSPNPIGTKGGFSAPTFTPTKSTFPTTAPFDNAKAEISVNLFNKYFPEEISNRKVHLVKAKEAESVPFSISPFQPVTNLYSK